MEILVVLLSGSSVCTQALTFDGDVPWVVPQDLRVPSEPKTDNLASNALMMVSNSMSTFFHNINHPTKVMYDKVEVHVTCYNNLVFMQSVPSLHWHADILSTPTHI